MGKAFTQKCGLLPCPCGLMSSRAFVLSASVDLSYGLLSGYLSSV